MHAAEAPKDQLQRIPSAPSTDQFEGKARSSNGDASVVEAPTAVECSSQASGAKRSGITLSSGSLLGGSGRSTADCKPFPVCEEIEIAVRGALSDSDAASDTNTCDAGSSFFLGTYLSPVLGARERKSMHALHEWAGQQSTSQTFSGPGGHLGSKSAAPSIASYGNLVGHRRKASGSRAVHACHSRSTSAGSLRYTCHSRKQSVGSITESTDATDATTADLVSRMGKEDQEMFPFW